MDKNQETSLNSVATPQDNTAGQAKQEANQNQNQVTPPSADKPVDQKPQDPSKPEDSKQSENKSDAPKTEGKDQKSEVPEKYEFKAPEGVALDPVAVDEFTTFAKESGLSQDKAQKAVDIATKHFQKLQNQATENFQKVREDWKKEMENHPTLGGAKYSESLEIAKRGVKAMSDIKGLTESLDSGWGDNPAFLELFHRIGLTVSEDKFVSGKPASGEKSLGDILYGKS